MGETWGFAAGKKNPGKDLNLKKGFNSGRQKIALKGLVKIGIQ
jgi:hypothetical protein